MFLREARHKPESVKQSGPVEGPAIVKEFQPDTRILLIQRVAASSVFGKSHRLRELFLFLSQRKPDEAGGAIHEQQIGVEVFDRRPDYDTTQDAIVRVQVSQLRKRLEQYFASEGRDEPMIIELPKGRTRLYSIVARPSRLWIARRRRPAPTCAGVGCE